MRQITEQIVRAFEGGYSKKISNSETDGTSLWLHDNKIAEHRDGGIWITNAGWMSRTTKERLNGITGVSISQKRGEWYLNGNLWDGSWICLSDLTSLEDRVNKPRFDVTSEWLGTYSKPNYSVYHTHEEADLQAIEQKLSAVGIETSRMYSDTQGRYKPNHFIVVPVADFDTAKNLIQ